MKRAKSTQSTGAKTWYHGTTSSARTISKTWDRWSAVASPYMGRDVCRRADQTPETRAAIEAASLRLQQAARIVQTFVDALAGSAGRHSVGIDANADTASTDLEGRIITLPASVILDSDVAPEDASALMVAYVAHEIGHVRHDNDLAKRLQDTYGNEGARLQVLASIQNVLRENRVEAGFVESFPGFGVGLFDPLLRYVSRGTKDGTRPPLDGLGMAVAAIRYPFRFDWSDPQDAALRDWWRDWAARYGPADDWDTHHAGLLAAETRVASRNQATQATRDAQTREARNAQAQQDAAHEAASQAAQQAVQDVYRDVRDGKLDWQEYRERVKAARKAAGIAKAAATRAANRKAQADAMPSIPVSVEDASTAARIASSGRGRGRHTPGDDWQVRMDAARSANDALGCTSLGTAFPDLTVGQRASVPVPLGSLDPDPGASRILRSAFARLRGGEAGRVGGRSHGRLDDRSLYRIANPDDTRLFSKRGARATQPLRVAVMIDVSGSMSGAPMQAMARLALALVDAARLTRDLHLEVWAWSDETCATPVWMPGDPVSYAARLPRGGGTNDVSALRFAAARTKRYAGENERPFVIMLTDGMGAGTIPMRREVEEARRNGVMVAGVASGSVDLTEVYGSGNWSAWRGSVLASAQPLADTIVAALKSR